MALGPAYHDTLANMQRSVKGTEFFVLGGSYGAFSSGAVSFWARENRLSPMAGCRGQAMVSPREGMDIPQGGEGYGALSKGPLRGRPMPTLVTRAPAQSPHTGPYGRLWDASGMLF
jgi:hypothetical protein